MTTTPFASALYPTAYTVHRGPKSLGVDKRDSFHTHTSIHAERLHWVSETILLPGRWNAQLLGYVIEPLPGANKNSSLWGSAIRITSLALWIITLPLAAVSFVIAFPLRCIDHRYRPAISYMDNSLECRAKSKGEFVLTRERPLHIRTHNVGFVTSSMSITGDLRPPVQRAKELAQSIVEDSNQPDVIFFQETFHENATQVLCEGIKSVYPYIVHSVAPQISGFNSGCMVASKYPMGEVVFQRLNHMLAPETMAPRGIIRVRLESSQGPVLLYGVHTQALLGKERADARFQQLEEIRKFMALYAADSPPGIMQVVMGDFNTSVVTAWGENNIEPKGQPEEPVLERLNQHFDDLFLRDHEPINGARTSDEPFFTNIDNARRVERLVEPRGSWFHGPFANPGLLLPLKMRYDRWKNEYPAPTRMDTISSQVSTWGTRAWRARQTANTARFDYILLPKSPQNRLDGRVEMRRTTVPANAQSASSDHLPLDGRIWIKVPADAKSSK
jgi:endonuclease/exonuclease/phosphatase family metal-dependent hydrolase